MTFWSRRAAVLAAAWAVAWLAGGSAAASPPPVPFDPETPIEVTADRLEYAGEVPVLIGRGQVTVTQGPHQLRADYVQVHPSSGDVFARGNVELDRGDGTVWRGEELVYNLRTGVGDFGAFHLQMPPFHVTAVSSEAVGPGEVALERALITPCREPEGTEFRITARRARLVDDRYLHIYGAVPWLGRVPFFYLPYMRRDLKRGDGRWEVVPGYSSRLGPFLLTAYRAPLDERETLRSTSFVHLYGRRGLGLGQELAWLDPDLRARGHGQAFYIRDTRLYRSASERERRRATLDDPNRYRFRVAYDQALTRRDRLFLDVTYLSDPFVREDFFRAEHREAPQPENRLTLTHRSPSLTAALLVNYRLNDFYGNVNRLPEARVDVPGLRLGETGLVYEGRHAAAALERVFSRESGGIAYDSVRVDSAHRLRYPGRYFGFLSLEPRAGVRATYYSRTRGPPRTVLVPTVVVDEDTGTSVEVLELAEEPGDDRSGVRAVYDLGLAASFRAFKELSDAPISERYVGLRHVAEPYADYQWQPTPNLRPARLYDFDDADRIDRDHRIRVGMRNKLQTRRGARVHDLLDVDVRTDVRLEPLSHERVLGLLAGDLRARPSDRFHLDIDTAVDMETAELDRMNIRTALSARDGSSVGIEYRYRSARHHTLAGTWDFRPEHPWSIGGHARFALDRGQLEEHQYTFRRRHRCVGWGVGLRHEPAQEAGEQGVFRLWMQVWLLTLPGPGFRLGG